MGKFIEHGHGKDASTQYTDTDGDVLEFFPTWYGDGVVLTSGDGVLVSSEDLAEAFERMSAYADMPGTFVPVTDSKVTVSGTSYICGVERSAVNIQGDAIDTETIRQVAANMLAIAKRMDDDSRQKEVEEKDAHNALRTSEIALEALELYKKRLPELFSGYETWDDTNDGSGSSDETVKRWIEHAELKRVASRAEVGDLVRVAADAKLSSGGGVFYGRSVLGVVTGFYGADISVRTEDPLSKTRAQLVGTEYVTRIAPAGDLPQLRDDVLLGLNYDDLTGEQQHLVDLVIERDQENE